MSARAEQVLHKWQQLAPWERHVLWQLAWRLFIVWPLLRVAGFKRTFRLFAVLGTPASACELPAGWSAAAYSERCEQLCAIAARHGLYRANCLHQSLVLHNLLQRSRLPVELRIGVERAPPGIRAHAWVELAGVGLGSQATAEYLAFAQLSDVVTGGKSDDPPLGLQ